MITLARAIISLLVVAALAFAAATHFEFLDDTGLWTSGALFLAAIVGTRFEADLTMRWRFRLFIAALFMSVFIFELDVVEWAWIFPINCFFGAWCITDQDVNNLQQVGLLEDDFEE